MPASHKSSKSLKYLTIIAIVLLVMVVVPYSVIEKARRDAEKVLSLEGRHLELDSVEFERESWLLFHFKAVLDTQNPGSFTESATWSLYPWELRETEGFMASGHIIISDLFQPDSETDTEDEELTDSDMIENGDSESDVPSPNGDQPDTGESPP